MSILVFVLCILLIVYLILLFVLSRGILRINSSSTANSGTPFVSVIVSAHNEELNIPGLISALVIQDYPENLRELIIVDDRSTDHTPHILRDYATQHSWIKVIQIEKTPIEFAPKKYAIDRAIQEAKGAIILLTDADGRPGPAWISTMSRLFSEQTGMVIGYAPYMIEAPYNKLVHRILALEYMSHAAIAAATTGLGYPVTCVGTNLAYRNSVYSELGGFGPYRQYHSGDDDLLMQRIRDETGWQISYATDSGTHVYNAPPLSLMQFFNQRLRYASKGFFYPFRIAALLVLFLVFNFILLISFILLFYNPALFFLVIPVLLIKAVGEFLLLRLFAKRTDQKQLLRYFIPAAILHLPYIVTFGILGPFLKYRWAGRSK